MFSGFLSRVIGYALIVGACYLYINSLQGRAVRAEHALADFKAQTAQKTAIKEAENKIKTAQAEKEYQANLKSHIEQLGAVLNNSDSMIRKEKAKHETLQTTIAAINAERDRLREQVSHLAGVSEGQSHAANSTGSRGECDAAIAEQREQIELLRKVAKVTTLDFNSCRTAFDTNCELTGCE